MGGLLLIAGMWTAGIGAIIAITGLLVGLLAVKRGARGIGTWAAVFSGAQLAYVVIACAIGLFFMSHS